MQADGINIFSYENCGVNEDMFPCTGKCCHQSGAAFLAAYVSDCPYCHISTSHPYGAGMKTVTISECSRLGYGKRVTE